MRCILLILTASAIAFGQKYTGPRPPKPDVLYLVHADNLIPTEVTEAKPETKKNEIMYSIPGTTSPARTPLAEPIFHHRSRQDSAAESGTVQSGGEERASGSDHDAEANPRRTAPGADLGHAPGRKAVQDRSGRRNREW